MIPWLVPIAVFWGLAAVYLGGAPVHITGKGVQQIAGLILHFAAYVGAYAAFRSALLGSFLGAILGGVVVPLLLASILLPILAKITFRLVGVRISSAA